MKKFENKEIELEFEKDKKAGYNDLAIVCLNQIPESGLPPLEMSKRIDLIKIMEKTKINGVANIEDADFAILLECSQTTRWKLIHKDIVDFNNYLEKLNK